MHASLHVLVTLVTKAPRLGDTTWRNLRSYIQSNDRVSWLHGIVFAELRSCVKVEAAVAGLPVTNSPYGLCGRKATLNLNPAFQSSGAV